MPEVVGNCGAECASDGRELLGLTEMSLGQAQLAVEELDTEGVNLTKLMKPRVGVNGQ
jgi:hypothetical protein